MKIIWWGGKKYMQCIYLDITRHPLVLGKQSFISDDSHLPIFIKKLSLASGSWGINWPASFNPAMQTSRFGSTLKPIWSVICKTIEYSSEIIRRYLLASEFSEFSSTVDILSAPGRVAFPMMFLSSASTVNK